MTKEEFKHGWTHFCKCIDFVHSALDAEAIRFMNEAPAKISQALKNADDSTTPYLPTGKELKKTEQAAKKK